MIDCDFIPADYHQARSLHRAVKLRGMLISAMTALMVLWVVANKHQVSSANAMLTEVISQHDQIGDHLAKKEAMEAEANRLRDHQRLLTQFESHASLVVVMSDISRRLPDAVVITQVQYRCPSLHQYAQEPTTDKPVQPVTASAVSGAVPPALPQPPPASTELKMTGFASEISEAIKSAAALERSPLMARVQMELKGRAVWAGRQGQSFELTCELLNQSGVKP